MGNEPADHLLIMSKKLKSIHPGEIQHEEFLVPLEICT